MSWKVEGTYMESCSCDAICPCIMLDTPTKGSCSALVGWKIDKGNDGDVDLSGLNVAFVLFSPGKMHETPWDVACFFDSRANPAQRESLARIFGGQAGGHPEVIASLVGKIIGATDAAIQFEKVGKNYVVSVENVAEVEMQPTEGQGGADITVGNHLLAVAPGFEVVVGTSKKSVIKTGDWDWNLTGQQCMASPFVYEA